jgi:DNA topoisomerase-6 subunit B
MADAKVANANEEGKSAEEMAKQYKEASISEFFEKNRHLLGYDNKQKALLIIVKEGVDNALDACEEARILPDIYVKVELIEKEKYRVVIRDNGPGVLEKHIPNVFGVLLYGGKFHRLRQGRGAQGLGISCAVLYSQLTTGEPVEILSSIGDGKTHRFKLKIDVKNNEPIILEKDVLEGKNWHGVQLTFICEGSYKEHKQSVLEYIRETSISNPYANLVFESPTGRVEFRRGIEKLPAEPKEIQPHLHGVEIGVMTRMLSDTTARSIGGFLTSDFTRVGKTSADEICKKAVIDPKISPKRITDQQIVALVKAAKEVKLSRPPTDILSPLGEQLVDNGLKKELGPEFIAVVSRPPEVYRGWPFQIEAGIAYGGALATTVKEPEIIRFANRVPLLYKQGDCAITKAIEDIDWKRYGLDLWKKENPEPVVLFVHMCSVWVPYTSESKEAIASYPIILKEIKLALQECARKLSLYLSGVRKAERIAEKKRVFEKYAKEVAIALEELTGVEAKKTEANILKMVEERWGEIMEMDQKEAEQGKISTEVERVSRSRFKESDEE